MLINNHDDGFTHRLGSEITPRPVYENRRQLLRLMAAGAAGSVLATWAGRQAFAQSVPRPGKLAALPAASSKVSGATTMEKLTDYKDASTYNNFYEFGTDKSDPAKNIGRFQTSPWSVSIEGLVKQPRSYTLEDLLKLSAQEERIYRLRCVEGWSMVIPWVGYSMAELIKKVEPLDEALHPLTLLAFGMYGEVLPKQNGAPLRLVVPWKYGFKSGKSLVKIRFTDTEPKTAWGRSAPQEYGFYSNVNPNVDHPRWSQATERRIGEDGLFAKRRKTLMFNGYEAQVGQMYAGMDLRKFY